MTDLEQCGCGYRQEVKCRNAARRRRRYTGASGALKPTGFQKFSLVQYRSFADGDPAIRVDSRYWGTGGPTPYPNSLGSSYNTIVVENIIYEYSIRVGGTLALPNQSLTLTCNVFNFFTDNMGSIPFASDPCPPGESRSYTFVPDRLIFSNLVNAYPGPRYGNNWIDFGPAGGVFEFDYEVITINLLATQT